MKRLSLKPASGNSGVVFGFNDQYLFVFGKHNISLHDGKHCIHVIIKLPHNPGRTDIKIWMLLSVVFQDKFLIKSCHILFINKLHKSSFAIGLGLQKSLDHQITNGHKHTVSMIIPVKLKVPVDAPDVQPINSIKIHKNFTKFFLSNPADVSMQKHHGGLEFVHVCGQQKIVILTNHLIFSIDWVFMDWDKSILPRREDTDSVSV